MESLEILKQELLSQKEEIINKGGSVNIASVNPSPSEITAGIKTIVVPNLSGATATINDVAEGKTFYSGNNTIKMGVKIIPDLTDADAVENDVILGKTFYAGDNTIKTGTKVVPDLTNADAEENNVEYGKKFYSGDDKLKTGTRIIPDLTEADAVENDVILGKTFYAGDSTIKTGTKVVPDLTNADAEENNVEYGKTFYSGDDKLKTGTRIIPDLTEADAVENDVILGKTFYSGDNTIKTGTKVVPNLTNATATASDVTEGKTFYSGDDEIKTGTKVDTNFAIATATASDVTEGKTFYAGNNILKTGTKTENSSGGGDSDLYYKIFVTGDDLGSTPLNFTLPEGTKSTRPYLLYNCKDKYVNITFNSDLETIGEYSFYNAINVEFENFSSLQNLKAVKTYAFYGLTEHRLNLSNLPEGLTTVSARAFYEAIQAGTDITIPSTVNTIGNYAFGMSGKTELNNLTIPSNINLTSVGASIFINVLFDCDFAVPTCITNVPSSFVYGSSFNNITIHSGVTNIGNNAFGMSSNDSISYRRLQTVTFEGETPPTVGNVVFSEHDKTNNFKIYVPDNSVEEYKSTLSKYADYIYAVSEKD